MKSVRIKQTVSYEVIINVPSAQTDGYAKEKALEEMKTRPVEFSKIAGGPIVEKTEVLEVTEG